MGDLEKDHHYSVVAEKSEHHEEKHEIPVVSTRRLRDREALKRKREEAQERDTFQRDFGKRQTRTKATGRGRRKQVKEPKPEPQPEHSLEPKYEPEVEVELQQQPQGEPEQEQKLVSDVPQEQDQQEQEPQEHHNPPPTVTDDEAANVMILTHEVAGRHQPEESSYFLKDKEEVTEADPEAAPEDLSISFHPEGHPYYTPLL